MVYEFQQKREVLLGLPSESHRNWQDVAFTVEVFGDLSWGFFLASWVWGSGRLALNP